MVRAAALRSFLRRDPSSEKSAAVGDGRVHEVAETETDPVLENMLKLLAAWRTDALPKEQVWPEIFEFLKATARNRAKSPPWWVLEDVSEEPA